MKVSKSNIIALVVCLTVIASIMALVSPTNNPAAVAVWFGLVSFAVYNLIRISSDLIGRAVSRLQSVLYVIPVLALVALSTLGQLTIVDLLTVLVLTVLVQIGYKLIASSNQ